MYGSVAFVAALVGGGLVLRGVFDWGTGFLVFALILAAWRVGLEHPR